MQLGLFDQFEAQRERLKALGWVACCVTLHEHVDWYWRDPDGKRHSEEEALAWLEREDRT